MIAQVIINTNAKELNMAFEYNVPEKMQKEIKIGSRVLVSFGRNKQLEEGFVVGFKEESKYKLKDIAKIEEEEFIEKENIELADWMAKRYFCNISDCIKLMLPPGTKTKIIENRIKEKTAKFVDLSMDADEINERIEAGLIKSEKHIRILKFLIENGETNITELEMFTDIPRSIIKTLEKNSYVEIKEKQIERNPFIHKVIPDKTANLKFTEEQQKAYNAIETAIDDKMNSEFLIFGVTGSRKNRNIFTSNTKSFK